MSNSVNTVGDDVASLASSVAQSTERAIRSTQRATQQGVDQLAGDLDNMRVQAGNAYQHLVADTEAMAHRGMDAVREKSQHARESTVSYIQHEPIKSVLMAAAVGAALMGLVALFSRHSGGSR
jgi:ElaB/YqjD/DUF883 family membrane-anchored ribosome-binding protein